MSSPITPDLEAAAAELLTACGQLVRRLRAASNNQGLTWSQAAILSRLESAGALSTADLARAESVKPQSMGASLAGLEADGLVQRSPHPSDGRQFLFSLTEEGAEARRRMRLAKHAWLSDALARLDEAERDEVIRATRAIARLVDGGAL